MNIVDNHLSGTTGLDEETLNNPENMLPLVLVITNVESEKLPSHVLGQIWIRKSRFGAPWTRFRKALMDRDVHFFWFWLSDSGSTTATPLLQLTAIRKSWWVVCDAQLFQASPPSVTANQCPLSANLTGRTGASPQQEGGNISPPWSTFSPSALRWTAPGLMI